MLEIRHKDDGKKGEFYIGEDGHHLAEMAYTWAGGNMLIIDHTLVEDELRGQSVGRKLLDQVVDMARSKNVKIIPLCPFSKSVFDKDQSIHDVLKS
ncbi:putative GNAT family acetyltransferase [Acinetobacter bereziniae]|uniref:GNAT family N-acetyltransferase n=1 Tax=Acinetobacter bereziniae TaxID=106648 RepID=UPI00285709DB|nr:GNAT family N-acetyltransferase [Acinetobacter bereziniae]MDR6543612.1 putative GNAT family acetyltransferase [Acinetobacter bereziniae]